MIILITGASRGIGREIAEKLAQKGYQVIANYNKSEEKAKEILLEDEITIKVDLKDGEFAATAYGCDLTYEYVKINGDYRT